MLLCVKSLALTRWTNHAMNYPDSKIHGANMGPIWDWQGPGGPHVGPMNFAIWVMMTQFTDAYSHLLTEKS